MFTVYSDNNPLTYVLTMAKVNATGHWWVAQLATHNFTICYRSGKANVEADALSWIEWDQTVEPEVVKVILDAAADDNVIFIRCFHMYYSGCYPGIPK